MLWVGHKKQQIPRVDLALDYKWGRYKANNFMKYKIISVSKAWDLEVTITNYQIDSKSSDRTAVL